jgi:hypothetical protein
MKVRRSKPLPFAPLVSRRDKECVVIKIPPLKQLTIRAPQ